ncbi:hypothetical protein ACJX0J_027265, partial [Zea mays]
RQVRPRGLLRLRTVAPRAAPVHAGPQCCPLADFGYLKDLPELLHRIVHGGVSAMQLFLAHHGFLLEQGRLLSTLSILTLTSSDVASSSMSSSISSKNTPWRCTCDQPSTVAKRLHGDWIQDPAIPVVTGFLGKGWKSGAITTLGQGGSDLIAITIGKALGLREIQVLHPQSMRPAREGDIPVMVKNSYNAKAPGTIITRQRDMDKVVLTSIVLKSNVTMLDIVSTRMLGQYGFLARVFAIFEDLCIYVDCVATSEVSVSVSLDPSKIWSRELIQQASELDHVVEELEKIAIVRLLQQRAIISLIGNVEQSSLILQKMGHSQHLSSKETKLSKICFDAKELELEFTK